MLQHTRPVLLRYSLFSKSSFLAFFFFFNLLGLEDSVSSARPLPMLWLNPTRLNGHLRPNILSQPPSFPHLTLPSSLASNHIIPSLCLEQLLLFCTYFMLLFSFAFPFSHTSHTPSTLSNTHTHRDSKYHEHIK